MSRSSRNVILALCLAALLAACSGGGAPAPTSAPAASGPAGSAAATAATGSSPAATVAAGACTGTPVTFCGHIKISGGVAKEADFTSGIFSLSCSAWLKGNKDDATRLTLPIALVGDINTDTVVQDYKGPGSYDVASLAGDLGGFQVAVGTDRFITNGATTGTAKLAADGSGSVTAKGMVAAGDGNKVKTPIDMSMSWTCYGP